MIVYDLYDLSISEPWFNHGLTCLRRKSNSDINRQSLETNIVSAPGLRPL
jgi:hypothetical protein